MFKKFNYLCDDAKKIRDEVFIKEQHFQNEYDDIDNYATHLVFYRNEDPIATCRFFQSENKGEYIVGRIAVLKEHRGNHHGEMILNTVEELIKSEGGTTIRLSAQTRVQAFYEKFGYKAVGEKYLDEHCEHINMKKYINEV